MRPQVAVRAQHDQRRLLVGLSESAIKASIDWVASSDPLVFEALQSASYPEPRHRPRRFSTLLQIITAQQISTRAADAVWLKLKNQLEGEVSADRVLASDTAELRQAGLSTRKATYALDLAQKCVSGELCLDRVSELDDEAAIELITRVKGLGRWSAEIYLLFAEGRADIWPANDLAVQVVFQRLHGFEQPPRAKAFYALSEKWSPHRSACALFMWHLYGAGTLQQHQKEP